MTFVKQPSETGRRSRRDLESNVFYLFSRATGWRAKALAEVLKPLSLSVANWRVLVVLGSYENRTIGQLAEMTTIDRTTLTRVIDQMERDQAVTRQLDRADRRRTKLNLTSKGRMTLMEAETAVAGHDEMALAGISNQQVWLTRKTLNRIIQNTMTAYLLEKDRAHGNGVPLSPRKRAAKRSDHRSAK